MKAKISVCFVHRYVPNTSNMMTAFPKSDVQKKISVEHTNGSCISLMRVSDLVFINAKLKFLFIAIIQI